MNNPLIDINDNNISQWVERFLDGETTCAEEQELYRYFSNRDLPADMEQYREMFAWYRSLGAGNDETLLESTTGTADKGIKARLLRISPWQWISVAASIAVLIAIGFIFRHSGVSDLSEEYMAYEGSYIIRDGKKITDLNIVVPEILRHERIINERIEAIENSFNRVDDAMILSVESKVDMTNPAVREAVETAFDHE